LPTIPLAEKKTVLEILGSFKGTGPVRELLAQLNYDPLNEPVSRKDWPEPAQTALAQDPRIYGQAAGDFYVIYAQLAADKLKLTDERTVIPQLLKEYPYALFVFSDKSQTEFHFVNVKWENNQKRRLYRRIAVGPQERLRTAVERISLLDIQTIETGLFGITAQQIQDRHDEAFDVAKVSKSFFDEYKRVFEVMRDAVKGFGPSEEEQDRRHLFTQRLFNRLMFLRFIQKKGWLTIDGSTDYLAALWASHGKLKQDGKNFYTDRLRLLFAALNNERVGIVLQGGGGTVEATIGKVKYLNGGLFEETDEDKDPKVRIADAPFEEVFDKANGLFEAFNFTITESTPLDIEIAVDPEMLGKIFEELVTGRHDSGSYYTPKPIVSFMCREALKGYLETQAPDEQKAAIQRFVDKHEPDDIRNAEGVLNALRRVTVCDPACGSGAYLLGMMHELLDLRQCLFQTRQVDNRTIYQRKLDIIQTNIYGVDIAEFAVNIARLRLWLSLSVDFDGPAPEPLPNLDYKIEVGDSICSASPGALQMGVQQPLVHEFLKLKSQFLIAHHADKQVLRDKVENLRRDIRLFSNRGTAQFDWIIDFAEVFINGGFDVVIANPPYVRMELFKDQKPQLRRLFPSIHSDRADLYCYFYGRAVELLNVGGMLSFISPNKWFRAKYGANLRLFLAETCEVSSITDFGELPVFDAATFPMIFIAQKGKSALLSTTMTQVRSLEPPYPNIPELIRTEGQTLPQGAIVGGSWNLSVGSAATVLAKLKTAGTPLLEYVAGEIFYGIKSGLNKAFIIDSSLKNSLIEQDPRCASVIKPFLVGDSIRKWKPNHSDHFLLYMHHGVNVSQLKPVLRYMKQFKESLEARATKQEWYELQQPQFRYAQSFEMPKIVFPDIAKSSRFAFDKAGCFVDTTGFVIPRNDLYLLGILNSKCVWHYLSETAAVLGDPNKGGRLRLKRMYVESIPIPIPNAAARKSVEDTVKRCLKLGDDLKHAEHELEEQVARLFDIDLSDLEYPERM
jgi:hypothetical protein